MRESSKVKSTSVVVSRSASERAESGILKNQNVAVRSAIVRSEQRINRSSYNNPFVSDDVLNEIADSGYNITVRNRDRYTVIRIENDRGENTYYFDDPKSDPARESIIKEQNDDMVRELKNIANYGRGR